MSKRNLTEELYTIKGQIEAETTVQSLEEKRVIILIKMESNNLQDTAGQYIVGNDRSIGLTHNLNDSGLYAL